MLQILLKTLFGARRRRTVRQGLGDEGERIALRYLEGLGYRIVATNVRVRLGDAHGGRVVIAEIDVIAYDGDVLTFVEVKTRRREGLLPTERAVDRRKRRLMARGALRYRRQMGVSADPFRFDVVTVHRPRGEAPRVRLHRGYFSVDVLRRSSDE